MPDQPAPRFVWYANTSFDNWEVLDTRPPDGEPGEIRLFGRFSDKASAVMTCMALNGVPAGGGGS